MTGIVLGEDIAVNILNFPLELLLGGLLRLLLILYLLFALLVIRQINLLNSILGTALSDAFRVFAYLHLLLAIGALVFAFLV